MSALFNSDGKAPSAEQSMVITNDDDSNIGQAEVTRDEFGGYCCKRWGTGGEQKSNTPASKTVGTSGEAEIISEDNICILLGLDIDKQALEIVK